MDYFAALISHIKGEGFLKIALEEKQIEEVKCAVEELENYGYLFFPEYLAILVLWRSKPFSRSKKTLVFLQQTRTKSMNKGDSLIEYM